MDGTFPPITFAQELMKALPSVFKCVLTRTQIRKPEALESLNNRKSRTVQCIREFQYFCIMTY